MFVVCYNHLLGIKQQTLTTKPQKTKCCHLEAASNVSKLLEVQHFK
jgi:hypothetical protein